MDITGDFHIALPREEVFKALNDPEVLGRCIPGCESLERTAENEYDAKVLAKIGPVKARFETRIEVTDLNPPVSWTLVGEGKGAAAGFVSGSAEVNLEEEGDGTMLHYTAKLQPGGKLAQIGSRLMGGTVRKLSADFFARFAEELGAAPESGA